MKTKIATLLGLTLDGYEGLIFSTYNHWCARYSKNTLEYQNHLNNQKIFNWFQNQLSIYEKEFLLDVESYQLSKNDNYRYFCKCIDKVFNHWPQSLGVKPSMSIKILINEKLN